MQIGVLLTYMVSNADYQFVTLLNLSFIVKYFSLGYNVLEKILLSFGYYLYIYSLKLKKNRIMRELDLNYPTCPIRNVLERISDKWSLLILCTLGGEDNIRYKELRTAIPDISHKMLTNTLKRLEEDHLVIRKAYAEIPPRVEYSLSGTGKTLMPTIQQMIDWAQQHFEEVTK